MAGALAAAAGDESAAEHTDAGRNANTMLGAGRQLDGGAGGMTDNYSTKEGKKLCTQRGEN